MMTNKKARRQVPPGLYCDPRLTLADLIERSAIREVFFLRFRPAAELLINGEELQFRKRIFVFLRHIRITWAVVVFAAIS